MWSCQCGIQLTVTVLHEEARGTLSVLRPHGAEENTIQCHGLLILLLGLVLQNKG